MYCLEHNLFNVNGEIENLKEVFKGRYIARIEWECDSMSGDELLLAACANVILFCVGTFIAAILCIHAQRYAVDKYLLAPTAASREGVRGSTRTRGRLDVLDSSSRRAAVACPLLGLALSLIAARLGPTLACAQAILLTCILFWASVVDVYARRIPDPSILVAVAAWLATLALSASLGRPVGWALGRAAVGCCGLAVPALIAALVVGRARGRPGLGGGDLKLFLVVGLYFGLRWGAFVIVASCVLGLLGEGLRVAYERVRGGPDAGCDYARTPWEPGTFPLCPAVSCAAAVVMIVGGGDVLAWVPGCA